MFPDRETVRRVTVDEGDELDRRDVVVVLSYDEELGPTESTSTLLVNPELRKEYAALQLELLEARDDLSRAEGTVGDEARRHRRRVTSVHSAGRQLLHRARAPRLRD